MLVVYLLYIEGSESLAPKIGQFSLGTWRNMAMAALEVTTVILLFLPQANYRASTRGQRSAA
jgi:hypothetical protein